MAAQVAAQVAGAGQSLWAHRALASSSLSDCEACHEDFSDVTLTALQLGTSAVLTGATVTKSQSSQVPV